ncbi:uncharacterized protein N7484_009296 [Penicillium longicatenatum]|uniref:uncharacterized protein n=1 Tax=Penicillium longicatenatum TaxID=1561947 RepID=UPI002549239E|nr:uncharacterized protein N7484_009296 [Penicillium longicatenatum]KAJ5635983.1 hypothetical protein N7484_009296 [Penicillium longicatenatum]
MAGTVASDKEQPLAGAVICFTAVSLEYRTQLVKVAKEMGAIERPDLTSEVTHLLVGATESAKYKFVARERNDVAVVRPEWIEAVRQSWVLGEDTDIRALEIQYKMPAFFGLTLCITGFSDMGLRTKMHDTSVENGAEFRKDLTKSVTHLISRTADGEKYKFATQWGIRVVSEKWFYDCIERGMILDEEKYHPLVPPEEQGVGAWNRPSLTPRGESRKEKSATNEGPTDTRPRKKLRRTASTKLAGQNENIWGDIIGAGFMNNETPDPANKEDGEADSAPPRQAIQAAKSFASESVLSQALAPEEALKPLVPEGFLGGSYFYLQGFSSKQMGVLHRHLGFNGAQCVGSLSDFSRPSIPKTGQGLYIMVPYQTLKSAAPSTDNMAFECEVVTDMWLEKCLHARALIPPESHVASTPFPKFPIPAFSEMRVCSTGFGGIDLLHVSKLVDLMGASYDEVLTPQASVLVCFDPRTASQNKLRHIKEWGVPAVSADWLWASIKTGQKKPFEPYLVQRLASQPRSSVEKPGAAFENEESAHQQREKTRDGRPKAPAESPNENKIEGSRSAKNNRTRIMPIIDDGFSNEDQGNAPKPSIPESRTPSPSTTADRPPTSDSTSNQPNQTSPEPTGPSALDTALKGLLQQAQAAKSRQSNENPTTNEDGTFPLRRKRKPLLGRATSHSSTKIDNPAPPSRASSIDTLNDDGLGLPIDSADPTRANSLSRTASRVNNESLSSMFSGAGGKFDFLDKQLLSGNEEDEENTEPQMTQLDYEDADAAAMRAEFLRDAGKIARKPKSADPGILLGEVKELEDVGWASGRRTRKHPRGDD